MKIDKSNKIILIKSGKWTVKNNIIIPKGYLLKAKGGLELVLNNNANIISYSPIEFIGTNQDPIRIYSSDSTGQGLAILNTNKMSTLKYVYFDNLSYPHNDYWGLTGSVNFYESDITMTNCIFSNNNLSEDALNIIRSNFHIDRTLFTNIYSDAFDGDFVNGKITISNFVNCGNDAIDVSGSSLDLTNIFINFAGDKGISAGEMSYVHGNKININNSEIGITSKDLSNVNLSEVTINNTKVGYTAFIKKPEFGPSNVNITNSILNDVELPYLIEEKSSMVKDGNKIENTKLKVEEILYGVDYGKKSN